jgi:hypothetical protein
VLVGVQVVIFLLALVCRKNMTVQGTIFLAAGERARGTSSIFDKKALLYGVEYSVEHLLGRQMGQLGASSELHIDVDGSIICTQPASFSGPRG